MKIKVGDKVKWACKTRPPRLEARGSYADIASYVWEETQGVGTVLSVDNSDNSVRVEWPDRTYSFWYERFTLGQIKLVVRNDIARYIEDEL
jgi:hypothetical protein